ncbi:MAG TPA: TylF/MycF/NovP-related O-methyltransferase [Mycobacteriales bacterium]|nr:TylF/MycF/NovP-related O-methyltransferase [Mycobacteriales bacterium]
MITDAERRVIDEVRMHTMISTERLLANMDAVEYVVRRGVPGALVECGVWRGGSVAAMIRVLQRLGVEDRDVYLYDTFSGMTEPEEVDTSPLEPPATVTWQTTPEGRKPWRWAFDPAIYDEQTVREFVLSTGYPAQRVHLVRGPVEETLPAHAPDRLALLRLDTDWYRSTLHELEHLYPRLSPGGVLIVDDVGHWDGARKAVDEYFSTSAPPIMLSRTDYSGRLGVKH